MELIFPKGEEPKKTAKNSVAIGTIKRAGGRRWKRERNQPDRLA